MIKLLAFGDPSLLEESGARLTRFTRQTKRFALLIYLGCDHEIQPHRRDELLATFWPEADGPRGRNALRQALHVIREELGPHLFFPNGREEIWLDPRHFDSDVRAFTRELRKGSAERALDLYRGDFLNGFHVPGCPEFGFWAEDRRARLKELASRGSQDLAYRAEGKEALEEALHWWRRALDLRPFDEALIRRIVTLLAGTGNRGEATAEFERFRHRLVSELGVEPSDLTLGLMQRALTEQTKDLPRWLGDRRNPETRQTEGHWRRPTDRQSAGFPPR